MWFCAECVAVWFRNVCLFHEDEPMVRETGNTHSSSVLDTCGVVLCPVQGSPLSPAQKPLSGLSPGEGLHPQSGSVQGSCGEVSVPC